MGKEILICLQMHFSNLVQLKCEAFEDLHGLDLFVLDISCHLAKIMNSRNPITSVLTVADLSSCKPSNVLFFNISRLGTYKTIRHMLNQNMNVYQYILSYKYSNGLSRPFGVNHGEDL